MFFFIWVQHCMFTKYQPYPQAAETNNKDGFIIISVTIGHNCDAGTLML